MFQIVEYECCQGEGRVITGEGEGGRAGQVETQHSPGL